MIIFSIGRKPVGSYGEIIIEIPDSSKKVSANHCKVYYEDGAFYIEDSNSLNKTYVNGSAITGQGRTLVRMDDNIFLGKKMPFSLNHPIIKKEIAGPIPIRPHNIDYASWGLRLGALLVDYAIVGNIYSALVIYGYMLFEYIGIALAFNISLLIFQLYFVQNISVTGQTWGKKLAGIKVLNADSLLIASKGQVWGRYFSMLLSLSIFCIGFFMPLWTKKQQALHDKLANTIVVKESFKR